MLRRVVLIVSVLLLTVGLLGGAALAHGKDNDKKQPPGQAKKGGVTTLTLFAEEVYSATVTADGQVFIDEEPPDDAFGVGARFFSTDELFSDEARSERVGENRIECTVTRLEGEFPEEPEEGVEPEIPADFFADIMCSGVVVLDGQGTLTWQGAVRFGADFDPEAPFATVAITGGTGDFIGARGEAVLFDISEDPENETLTRYEITLLRR